ncbi:MAG: methyltransferase domain-containing protein, partial [Nocardioidaceae bacterium]
VLCTHSGLPWQRRVDGRLVVNVGVVGKPANDGHRNVWYAVLDIADSEASAELVPLDYDWAAQAGSMRSAGLPEPLVETIETGWWTTCVEVLPPRERARGRFHLYRNTLPTGFAPVSDGWGTPAIRPSDSKGNAPDGVGRIAEQRPVVPVFGTEYFPPRLWMYTNFHCNLACDYCVVASSPTADPRSLDLTHFTELVDEALRLARRPRARRGDAQARRTPGARRLRRSKHNARPSGSLATTMVSDVVSVIGDRRERGVVTPVKSHPVFAACYDLMMAPLERQVLATYRRELLGDLAGDVLDVGAGTGVNLPYLRSASRVSVTEPDAAMRVRLTRRKAAAPVAVEVFDAAAESLPFPDSRFDAVVFTCVLCTVADPARALAEARRVLRPGGTLVVLEHVRGTGRLAGWQDRVTPLWRRIAAGCHPNRDTRAAIEREGFRWVEVTQFQPMPAWLPVSPMLAGTAVWDGPDAHG